MNRYNLTARVFPMLLFYLPLLILAVIFSIEIDKKIHVLSSCGVIAALSYFNAQLGRKYGKRKELALWQSWDGAPTTQVLRWRSTVLDDNTKKRYHFKLQSLCPVNPFPTEAVEAADQLKADAAYNSWITYLISQTRDTKKFSLLFSENINYGFWRNLWALKNAALLLDTFVMVGLYLYFYFLQHTSNPLSFPAIFFISEALLLVILFLWAFVITSDSIKIPAFGYAERLVESINEIKN
ncbi:MAG: hypothetical protein V4456_11720 [Bacteroidota bacterium]